MIVIIHHIIPDKFEFDCFLNLPVATLATVLIRATTYDIEKGLQHMILRMNPNDRRLIIKS